MGSVVRRRSATRRERPSPATTAERWRLLEAIERSRSAGWAGVSGGGRNATLGSVAREPQRERRTADCHASAFSACASGRGRQVASPRFTTET